MRVFSAGSRPHPPGRHGRGARLLHLSGGLAICLALLTTLTTLVLAAPDVAAAPQISARSYGQRMAFSPPFNHILHVPAEYPTIQAAVDRAQSGDLVLIAKGVYSEEVKVTKSDLTIRGEDRLGVQLDGKANLGNGLYVTGDRVIIENLTVHHYRGNGVWFYHQTGYRASYVTAYDNGDYGIYARGSVQGEFDHSLASGSPDSGFYIGECFPCDALITDVRSQWNGLGYSGTNAGGNLIIRNSIWTQNSAGIVPNSLLSEKLSPERGATIVNNQVFDNNNADAPAFASERDVRGVGIGLMGGDLNYVANNDVRDHDAYGILVGGITTDNTEHTESAFFVASGNVVEGNTVQRSGLADLAMSAPTGAGNCFKDNKATTTLPPLLVQTHPCGSPLNLIGGGDMAPTLLLLSRDMFNNGPNYHPRDYTTVSAPPANLQPNMPDVGAPRGDIFTEPFTLSADLPNHGLPAQVGPGGPSMLLPLGANAYTFMQILLSLFGNFLFFALYAVWLAIAVGEIATRSDLSARAKVGWSALAILLPIFGPIVYFFAGKSKLARGFLLWLVVGAPVALIVITAALLAIASQIQ